jgi:copper chaperone CopZ
MSTLLLNVENMKCGGCIAAAEAAVSKLPGVESARFDLETASGIVEGAADPQTVVDALTAAGYPSSLKPD